MESNFNIQFTSDIEERILKENVLIDLNMDVNERNRWGEENALASDTFTIVIPLSYLDKNVSVKEIDKAFFTGNNQITIDKNEIKIKVFTGETNFLNSIKDIHEEVESTVRYVSNILDGFRIKDFKLICDFYIWVD